MSLNAPAGARPPLSRNLLLACVLAGTALAYVVTFHFGFVYDDLGQIVMNPAVQSWRYFPQYFHANVWMQQTPIGNYYRPLFLTWLLVNYTVFGLHPAGWHLMTVLAHLGATALVFLLALRLTSDKKTAAVAALLFGLHPIHLESVAWISGVTDPLMALFFIPAFLAYLNYGEATSGGEAEAPRLRRGTWLAMSLGFYALALLTKETAAVLPVLIVGYHLLCSRERLGRRISAAIAGAWPFAVLTAVYLVVRVAALHGLAHTTVELPGHIAWLTIPSVLWFYVKLLVAPVHLSAFYDTPYITHVSWKYFLGPLLGVGAATALVVMAWRKWRSPLVGLAGLWMVLPLLPVLRLSVLPMGDFVHDRYLYLPSVGFCLLVAMALRRLEPEGVQPGQSRAGVPWGWVVTAGIVLAIAVGTVAQSFPWADDLPLYEHGMKIAPHNDLPRNKLAATLVQRGQYEQGIRAYAFVLANDPDYWYANYRMGFAHYMLGRYPEAERYLGKAVALHPVPDENYFLGLARLKLTDYSGAEAALREAVREAPNSAAFTFALGMAQKQQGKREAALESFRAVLAIAPSDAAALEQVAELQKAAASGK